MAQVAKKKSTEALYNSHSSIGQSAHLTGTPNSSTNAWFANCTQLFCKLELNTSKSGKAKPTKATKQQSNKLAPTIAFFDASEHHAFFFLLLLSFPPSLLASLLLFFFF